MEKRSMFLLLLIILVALYSCKEEQEPIEVPCQKNVIEGRWTRDSNVKIYFETKDSLVENNSTSIAIFYEDGSGEYESNATATYFQWVLQCSPDILMENRISTPLAENPEETETNYIAFPTYLYEFTKITMDEVHMNTEYYLGVNETRRRVNRTLILVRE